MHTLACIALTTNFVGTVAAVGAHNVPIIFAVALTTFPLAVKLGQTTTAFATVVKGVI